MFMQTQDISPASTPPTTPSLAPRHLSEMSGRRMKSLYGAITLPTFLTFSPLYPISIEISTGHEDLGDL